MEKNQYELCLTIFDRLKKANILDHIVLVGSWCIFFYRKYFENVEFNSTIRTRDIDLAMPVCKLATSVVDVPNLFLDLGFVKTFDYVLDEKEPIERLVHPDLIIDFLVPGKGSSDGKPRYLPGFCINAQEVHFLHMLTKKTIIVSIEKIDIKLPHPAYFAIHKLIVSTRRPSHMKNKAEKDLEQGLNVLKALLAQNDLYNINQALLELSPGKRKTIECLLARNGVELL